MKYLMVMVATLNIASYQVFGRGCCSHHGGQAYCSNGRWVCKDGTYSPTCTCSNYKVNTTKKKTTTTTTKKITTTTKKDSTKTTVTTQTAYVLNDANKNNNVINTQTTNNDSVNSNNVSPYLTIGGLTGLGSYILKKHKK